MKTSLTVDVQLDVADPMTAQWFEDALMDWMRAQTGVVGARVVPHNELNSTAWKQSRAEEFASPRQNPFGRADGQH